MAAKGYVLSEASVAKLRAVADRDAHRVQNPQNRPYATPVDDGSAPEVYVVTAPIGGIPAKVGSVLGSASASVSRVLRDGTLEAVTGLTRTVWNSSGSPVAEAATLAALRDKFGNWFATPLGGSVSFSFTIQEVTPAGSTYTDVTTIRVIGGHGLITASSTGAIDFRMASSGTGGFVGLGAQQLGTGPKGADAFNSSLAGGYYVGYDISTMLPGAFGGLALEAGITSLAAICGLTAKFYTPLAALVGGFLWESSSGSTVGGYPSNTNSVFYSSGEIRAERRYGVYGSSGTLFVGYADGASNAAPLPITVAGVTLNVLGGLITSTSGDTTFSITIGATTVSGGVNGNLLTITAGAVGNSSMASLLAAAGGISGTF